MQTHYRFFQFVQIAEKPKTSVWSCRNNRGQSLGLVKWYSSWRQYCYFANTDAVYSRGCLSDIATFLGDLSDERERQRVKEETE